MPSRRRLSSPARRPLETISAEQEQLLERRQQQMELILARRRAALASACSKPQLDSSLREVLELPVSGGAQLHLVLDHPLHHEQLRAFMSREHNDENLCFLDYCTVFFDATDPDEQVQMLDAIEDLFVGDDAPGKINISDAVQKALREAWNPLDIERARDALGAACTDVEAMIVRDVLPRFKAPLVESSPRPTFLGRLRSIAGPAPARRSSLSHQYQPARAAFLESPAFTPTGLATSRRLSATHRGAEDATRFLIDIDDDLRELKRQYTPPPTRALAAQDDGGELVPMKLSSFLETVREGSDPAPSPPAGAGGTSAASDGPLLSSEALRRRFLNTL